MTNKHTPGPWKVEEKILSNHVFDAEGFLIADCHRNNLPLETMQANARLIAAAPETAAERDRLKALNAELLTELINLFAMVEGEAPKLLEDHHSWGNIRAVIAKAKESAA